MHFRQIALKQNVRWIILIMSQEQVILPLLRQGNKYIIYI